MPRLPHVLVMFLTRTSLQRFRPSNNPLLLQGRPGNEATSEKVRVSVYHRRVTNRWAMSS